MRQTFRKFAEFLERQLSLPLFQDTSSKMGRRTPSPIISIPDEFDWSEDDVAELHRVILFESLQSLSYRGNPAEKMEVLEWIFADDVSLVDGKPLYANDIPFSFNRCCAFARMRPEHVQNELREALAKANPAIRTIVDTAFVN